MLLSDPGPQAGPFRPPQRWIFDTGCSGEGLAWRQHLEDGGLDTGIGRASTTTMRTASGLLEVPVRKASIWLFSNIPAYRQTPYCIALNPGMPFRDADWPISHIPDHHAPIFGLRPLLRAGLRVYLDGQNDTLSVWVPGSWVRGFWVGLRRIPTRYRVVDPAW